MPHPELAQLFRDIAEYMTILGSDIFKIRAHERAAATLDATPEDVALLAKEHRLRELPGIGEAFAKKIEEYFATGKLAGLEELRVQVPPAVLEIRRVPGLGPKKAKQLCDELALLGIPDLEKACREGRVRVLKGMGAKSEEKILAAIASLATARERTPLYEARDVAAKLVLRLRAAGASEVIPTGSLRRWKDTVRDVDVVAVASEPEKIMQAVTAMPGVKEVLGSGPTKTSVVFGQDRLQIDVRVVPKESLGAALQYFTGSKEHNVRLRERAQKMGLTVNEYGVFRLTKAGEKGEKVAGETEEGVYKALGLPWIPPELREDKGEFDGIPRLVERKDIRGDLHAHTTWSDGTASVEEMARAAEALGYEYMAITDHSPTAAYAGGLSVERLKRQWEEIDRVQEKVKVKILKGTEADILAEGRIDWPDDVLEKFDFVVASIHQRGKDDREANTRRLVRAIEHPGVDLIGHPSTRRLGQRGPLEIDWEEVFAAAKKHGTALELNSSPERLDLEEKNCVRARQLGVPIFIDTDSHSPAMYEQIEYGIHQARRAWLKVEDVVNTKGLGELLAWLRR